MLEKTAAIRVVIVEDEPLAREGLRLLLREDPELELVGEAHSGRGAVEVIEEQQPDLVFLDVQIPEMDGFEVLRRLSISPLPQVVFVTAYDRYAIRAFEVHALDYLLKPFDDERFFEALRRVKAQLRLHRVSELSDRLLDLLKDHRGEPAAAPAYLERLTIRDLGRIFFLPSSEIDWIEAADYYVEVHANGRSYLHRETMNRLATQLDPRRFVRIHRSAIVNSGRIREVRHQGRDATVVLQDGAELKVARSYRSKLTLK